MTSVNDRKSTQRERLLAGMLNASLRHGYADASVTRTIVHAGVSRPTFYDYFTDKDDCFLAIQRETSEQLVDHVARALDGSDPSRAVQTGALAIIAFAETDPDAARFLMEEAIAGGQRALEERKRTIAQIKTMIERARSKAPASTPTPDLPIGALIGGLHWLLAPVLRRGELDLSALAQDVETWIDTYLAPADAHRWRTLEPGPTPPPQPHVSDLPREAPRPLPRGRPRISAAEVARNQRDRILYATATVASRKGYTATTVADIASAAKLDRRVFYNHFQDKQQAFLAVHEFALRHAMTLAAGAFFSATTWPERIWEGILASCQFGAGYPAITRIAFVDSHAVGAPAIQRVEDSHAAFTIFLHEGFQHTTQPPPHTALQAIVTTIFEIGYHQALDNNSELMPRLAGHATYLALTPFLGPQAANEFIDGKLEAARLNNGGSAP